MDTVIAIGLLGITQGISSWIYFYFFPNNFFFTVIFCHKNGGLLLAFLFSKIFKIKDKYVDDILYPLITGMVGYTFMRLEAFVREHYLLPALTNLPGGQILIFYMIPFYTFWALVNWSRKNVHRLSSYSGNNTKSESHETDKLKKS